MVSTVSTSSTVETVEVIHGHSISILAKTCYTYPPKENDEGLQALVDAIKDAGATGKAATVDFLSLASWSH